MAAILIIEDNALLRRAMAEAITRAGHRVIEAGDLAAARAAAACEAMDVVVADLQLPDGTGLTLLEEWKEAGAPPPFVLISGVAQVEDTVRALRLGVADCLTKPFSVEELRRVVGSLLGPHPPPVANATSSHSAGGRPSPETAPRPAGPVVASRRMAAVFTTATRVAPSTATVLIEGESGTGKEVVARHIHLHSDRRRGPFVAINCAALPDGLLESELFGHERGAFSGAVQRHIGRFEQGHGGTLLLDEIGEMALPLQAKLLRTLQERVVQRVGGSEPIPVDVRILATTNQSLRQAVQAGRFRLDLYYRLHVIRLRLPPLRQRPEEIPVLIRHFFTQFAQTPGERLPILPDAVAAELASHSWPGNVRELENAVHRALLLGNRDHLRIEDFLDMEQVCPASPPKAGTVTEMERDLILTTLGEHDGNRSQTAATLGISVRTLRNRLREYRRQGLEVTPARSAG
jgi:DNA-binding NtrC family response regulator